MSDDTFERLLTDGFSFVSHAIKGANLSAYYGDGYGEGARIGDARGLRTWKATIAVLPDVENEQMLDAGMYGPQTRFAYLFAFYERHNVANARKPFWLCPHGSALVYLAEIVEEELDFQQFSAAVYGTGLTFRQRRVFGVPSPILDTGNNAEI